MYRLRRTVRNSIWISILVHRRRPLMDCEWFTVLHWLGATVLQPAKMWPKACEGTPLAPARSAQGSAKGSVQGLQSDWRALSDEPTVCLLNIYRQSGIECLTQLGRSSSSSDMQIQKFKSMANFEISISRCAGGMPHDWVNNDRA